MITKNLNFNKLSDNEYVWKLPTDPSGFDLYMEVVNIFNDSKVPYRLDVTDDSLSASTILTPEDVKNFYSKMTYTIVYKSLNEQKAPISGSLLEER